MPRSNNAELISLMFASQKTLQAKFKSKKFFNPISLLWAEILNFIRTRDNPTMKDVSDFLCITPPSVTAIVDKLVTEKYLQRIADKVDRRKIHLMVSAKGSSFANQTFKKIHSAIDEVLNILSHQDKQNLIRIYHKLLTIK